MCRLPGARVRLGLEYITLVSSDVQAIGSTSRILLELRTQGEKAIREFRALAEPLIEKAFVKAGAGPSFLEEDEAGTIFIESEILERYPNCRVFQIEGDCMEPDFPNGHYALVVPDMALATTTSAVCVWLSDNGRVIKYLGESREDGDHVLYQTNPSPGEQNVFFAPVGSIILGVVVDVIRGGVPRRSVREIWNAIEEQLPALLEHI